jgi:pimeloyl-ACP methyl ester carboxylesterase
MMLRPWQLRASLQDGALMLQSAAALQPSYGALKVPTYIAAGRDDRIVDQQQSKRLHEQVRARQLEILPGIGHMVHHSAWERVAAIIDRAATKTGEHAGPPIHEQRSA